MGSPPLSKATLDVTTICGDPGAPARAVGGGDGGPSPCTTQPFGPLAEVQAVWAAVNAQQAPDPSDPNYVEDVYNPAGDPRDDVVVESSWYRVRGPDIQVKYMVRCPGALAVERWVTVTPDAGGNLVPQVRAVDLLSAVHAQVVRQLPTPVPRIGPADENPNGWTYVQHRTFFWVDVGAGQWAPVTGTTSAGGISVTVQAVPERLVINPGDGSDAIVCVGAPVPVTRETYRPDIDGCAHRYLQLVGDGAERCDVPGRGVDRVARHVVGVDGGGWGPGLPLDDVGRPAAGGGRGAVGDRERRPVTVVYTDGACSGNPGPGGWAWAVAPDGTRFGSGGEPVTTNQRMEITAVLEAVAGAASARRPIEVVSDSTYVVNCFRDKWYVRWAANGWRNAKKQPVANADLWRPLVELVEADDVTFRWVKGHSGDRLNDLVDQLAVAAIPR